MSGPVSEKSSKPRVCLGIKLILVFVALAVLPAAGVSYYALTQAQAGESAPQPGAVILVGAALAGIIAVVVAVLLARSITRPIRRLSDAAEVVKNGQPFEPSDIADVTTRSDEIAHLGHAFGDMVATLHRRLTELEMAYEIGQDITASVEVDETLQAILDRVKDVIAYDAAEITLYDRRENALFVKAWRGKQGFVDTRGKSYRIGVGLTGQIAKDRKSLLIGDAHTDAGQAPTGKTGILTLSILVRSILGVPLIIRGRLVGTRWPSKKLNRCASESKSCGTKSSNCASRSTRASVSGRSAPSPKPSTFSNWRKRPPNYASARRRNKRLDRPTRPASTPTRAKRHTPPAG
jgi:HAMP domain-containing protein